ncbi:MAG: 23S rRNA (uracil(1939)-C(5))-methyltransferase RlmD [Clostridia bacterium]|nr:23S rRNA (uracil(1939)-C(5))-methyltransferase RlmD [Clostridia bacterium]
MSNVLPCPVAKKCGGCQLTNMTYAEQLSFKQRKAVKLLGRFCRVEEILPAPQPYHYRNKVQAAFGTTRSGLVISGVYQSGTHTIVKTDACLIEDKRADAIIVSVRNLLKAFKLPVYNEDTGRGFLRHVLVRVAKGTGEIMVVLVTGTPVFPSKNAFCRALSEAHPEITTIVQNINDGHTSLVLGTRETVLYGEGHITDLLLGKRFHISPRSFYQVNYETTEILYEKVLEYAGLTGCERVIDAYAGVGTIGMALSDAAGEVVSVELNADAVQDARKNAKLNGVKNMRFICADATVFLREMAAAHEHADVVIMDPPRAGSTPQFIKSVCTLKPDRVVYVSCNPETLARDLVLFEKQGYRVKKCQPVDMFPQTNHVETVVSLVRKIPDMYVGFKIDLDEQDLTASEAHPTYEEIKAYIQKEYGVKVSSLYISQVKRKLGLEVGESFKKPKKENTKQPQCPPDKERIIIEALKHFKMI